MDGTSETGSGMQPETGSGSPEVHQQKRSRDQRAPRRSRQKLPKLPQFWTIGRQEAINVADSLRRPLSGYIGGRSEAGYWITRLQDEWCETFHTRYAVPCNSATSGLLAACMAADIGDGDTVWVPTYTMSATASCAITLGARVEFMDISPRFFTAVAPTDFTPPKAIIVTNLFGCAAPLIQLREFCDQFNIVMIEDNAQAPFATHNGIYTGTIGHMGVFSLNVHKHIQCGEGGVVVTNDPKLAHRLDCAINHGELMRTDPNLGLNLRMTEPIAAIASAQLKRGSSIVQTRISLAEAINDIFRDIPFVELPHKRENSDHVFYLWAGKITGDNPKPKRERFLEALRARDVPFRSGYSIPLHRLFGPPEYERFFPVANEMEDERLFCFEICAFDPKKHHLKIMRDIIHAEAEKIR